MTSTPAISPAPAPAESAPSAAGNGQNQDFATALSGADAKPAPKSPHAKVKTAAPAGLPLPIGGIVSPPSAPVNPIIEATLGGPLKAVPAEALAAAVLPQVEADPAPAEPVIPTAPVAAPPKAALPTPAPVTAAAAVLEPAPAVDAVGSVAGADPKAAAASAPVAVPAAQIQSDPTPVPSAALPVAVPPSKPTAPRVAGKAPATESAPAADRDETPVAASSGDAAASAAPAAPTTDPVATGSAADAARAAAAVVFSAAPAAASNAAPDPGTSPADTLLGLTVATVNANQNAAAATLTAAAVKAAVSATLLSTATAQDKHGHSGDALSAPGATNGAATGPADPTQLGATSSSAPDASPAATMNVSAHVETPEFGQGVAERVSWMLDNNVSSAKLQVNPPQLGPIEVRIALQAGHAQVWLTSHSAVTRDALESNSSKLREALGAQGFGQVSVDISQRSFQDRPRQPQPYEWTPSADRGSAASAPLAVTARSSSGVLDAYA